MDQETLVIDDWIYSIGSKGGLYHKRPGSDDEPKRIHFSHPPIPHRERVKSFQDAYLKKHNLWLAKRWQPQNTTKIKETTEKTKENKKPIEKTKEKKSEKKKNVEREHKLTRRINLQDMEEILYCVPTTKTQCKDNMEALDPEHLVINSYILEQYFQHFVHITSNTKIYISTNLSLAHGKRLVCERFLFTPYPCDVPAAIWNGGKPVKIANEQDNLFGIYAPNYYEKSDDNFLGPYHQFLIMEPKHKNDDLYRDIVAKCYLCAKNMNCKIIVFDFDSFHTCTKLAEALNNLLSCLEKNGTSQTIEFRIISSLEQKWHQFQHINSLETALEKEDLDITLIISAIHSDQIMSIDCKDLSSLFQFAFCNPAFDVQQNYLLC